METPKHPTVLNLKSASVVAKARLPITSRVATATDMCAVSLAYDSAINATNLTVTTAVY